MKIIGRKKISLCLLPALLAAVWGPSVYASTDQQCLAVASTVNKAQSENVQHLEEPTFTVLQDKLHSLRGTLLSKDSVHYYGFVAERGQDVLLAFPGGDSGSSAWQVEYYENGKWLAHDQNTKVFSNLAPGADVIMRVMVRDPQNARNVSYSMTFGSYPVLKSYDLLDEPGVIRIPVGNTEPGWLATQIYKETVLEVKFTDTKDVPLAGGIALFALKFAKGEKSVEFSLVSDTNGFATKRIELGRCYGGVEAVDFVDKQKGFNTWRTYYKVGGYVVNNVSLGVSTKTPHVFYLGHICKQTVLKTIAPRS